MGARRVKSLVEYWPIIVVALQAVTAWAAWSLRTLAKKEIVETVALSEARTARETARLDARVDEHGDRLLRAESGLTEARKDIESLPTKADIARLEGQVAGVGREVKSAADGIHRLEVFFIQKGVEHS
jgi:predicted  nucleic acid-binding Zn-ribbon protein